LSLIQMALLHPDRSLLQTGGIGNKQIITH
jgi:hypothetical protein